MVKRSLKRTRDICPVCRNKGGRDQGPQISIQDDPSHFDPKGEPATPGNMLRCVLYEIWTLAAAVQALQHYRIRKESRWPKDSSHDHPTLGPFDPSELIQRSALISFRLLYGFLYREDNNDDFGLKDFEEFGVSRDDFPAPEFNDAFGAKAFTTESTNKFVAHLTWTRINKSKCIPQPKFEKGVELIVENSMLLLHDAERFVRKVTEAPNFPSLCSSAEGYRAMFFETMRRIREGSDSRVSKAAGKYSDREVVEIFIETVNELRDSSFAKQIKNGVRVDLVVGQDGLFSRFDGPERDTVKAFLLTLRFFGQNNEETSLQNMSGRIQSFDVGGSLIEEFQRLRYELNTFLDEPLNVPVQAIGADTKLDVYNAFLYGIYAHANPTRRRKVKEWERNPFYADLEAQFCMIAAQYMAVLAKMAETCNRMLATGKV